MSVIGVLSTAGQFVLQSILVKPKRAIGNIHLQVFLEEVMTDELEITQHPVEQGATISDHAFKRPAEVVIRAIFANTVAKGGLLGSFVGGIRSTASSVQALLNGNGAEQVLETYNKLLVLQGSRIPFDVLTGKRSYSNMLMQSLAVTVDQNTEYALSITARLQEVRLVRTQTVVVSAAAQDMKNPASTLPVVNTGTTMLQPGAKYVDRPRGGE